MSKDVIRVIHEWFTQHWLLNDRMFWPRGPSSAAKTAILLFKLANYKLRSFKLFCCLNWQTINYVALNYFAVKTAILLF